MPSSFTQRLASQGKLGLPHSKFRTARPLTRRLASKREEPSATRLQAPDFTVIKFHCSKHVKRRKTDVPPDNQGESRKEVCRWQPSQDSTLTVTPPLAYRLGSPGDLSNLEAPVYILNQLIHNVGEGRTRVSCYFKFPRWFQHAHKFRHTHPTTTYKRFRKAEDVDWQSLLACDCMSIHSILWLLLA